MKEIKVGIAGYGLVGHRRRKYIDTNPSLKLTAICDKKFDSSDSDKNGVTLHNNYKELIKEDLDVLFVSMSNDMSAKVTKAGLESGLHVFCEKPPARNMEELLEVLECEKKNSHLKLMYGFNHRHHDSIQDALDIKKSGTLGKILNMRAIYGKAKLIMHSQADWRIKRELAGGGILLDQGIHMIDLILLFGGSFNQVYSFVLNDHWKLDVEDNAYAIMKSSKGIVAMLHSSATQWRHRFSLEVNFEKGSLILEGILSGTKSYGAETLTVVSSQEDDFGDPSENITRYNKDPSWEREVEMFSDCVVNNKQVKSGSSKDALEAMRLVYKIYYNDINWRKEFKINNPDL